MNTKLQKSIEYLNKYISVSPVIVKKIIRHAKRYGMEPEICAWYTDWEDFCSDWCDECGYTRTEARRIFHGGIGEFMVLSNNLGIVRFAI